MSESNVNSRLETFCDGVFAIALTLLIIDIRIPAPEHIADTADLWRALERLLPAISAFILSFGVILITWVNHHAMLKLVHRSTSSFMYANGFLLLTVVFVPFPTSLLGEFLLTDHAAPAVMLYDAVLSLTAVGWILIGRTAGKNALLRDAAAAEAMQEGTRNGYFAFGLYALLALVALWLPLTAAIVTLLTWVFWLVLGIRMHGQ